MLAAIPLQAQPYSLLLTKLQPHSQKEKGGVVNANKVLEWPNEPDTEGFGVPSPLDLDGHLPYLDSSRET